MFNCIMGKTLPLFAEKYEKLLQCKNASLFIAKKFLAHLFLSVLVELSNTGLLTLLS